MKLRQWWFYWSPHWVIKRLISFVAMLLVMVVGTLACWLVVHAMECVGDLPWLEIGAWAGVLIAAASIWAMVDNDLWS